MAKKYRKLKKQKIHYGKRNDRKKVIKTVLFILLLLALMFLAYSVMDPIKKLLSGEFNFSFYNATSSQITSQGATNSSESKSSEATSSKPESANTFLKGTTMPIQTALDGAKRDAFIKKAKEEGYTAIAVEMKDANGTVWFQSDAIATLCKKAVAENALSAKELASKIKEAGMTPIATVHTFRDKIAPDKALGNTFMITGTNSTWWDNSADKGGKPWLNPHKETARSYNTKVVEELAKAGFAEVQLCSVQFPDISYKPRTDMTGEKTIPQILTQYINEAKKVAEQNGAKVLVSYNATAYLTTQKISYGGEAGEIQADRISPVIRLSDYGTKLTIGKTVLENPSGDITKTLDTVLSTIKTKTAAQKPEIIPVLVGGKDRTAMISALQKAGIQNYIIQE